MSHMNLSKRIENKGKETKRLREKTCFDIKSGNKFQHSLVCNKACLEKGEVM
jgi:hypothetical protein